MSHRQWRDPAVLVACGLGSGFAPVAPGTFGSLAAVLVWWWLLRPMPWLEQLGVILAVAAIGTYLIGRVQRRYRVNDASAIVVDEFAGQWLTLLAAPGVWWVALLGFALFRLFDIWKPWPIGALERRVGGAFGVMVDDLAAGLLSLIVLQVTLWLTNTF